MPGAKSLKQLRALSREDLIKEHDAIVPRTEVGVNYYLDELARRDLVGLTKVIVVLTAAILVLTAVLLVDAVV